MRRVIVIALICVAVGFGFACADTVVLKSGKKIDGKITERKTDLIMIDVEGVGVPYFLDEIVEINGEKVVLPAPAVVPEKKTQAATASNSLTTEADAVQLSGLTSSKATSENTDIGMTDKRAKLILTVTGIILAVLVIVYVYTSLCLFLVAKKLMKEPAWLAWVPIGNLVLTCKLANISYWWLVLILLSILPYIGFLSAVVFSAFAWWHIAQARGKPAWLGILTIIPLVNLVIIGYLAFSE